MKRILAGIFSLCLIGVTVAVTVHFLSSKAVNQSSEASYKDIDRTFTSLL